MRNAKEDIPPAPGPLSVDTDDRVEFYKNAGCISFDTSQLPKDERIYVDPDNPGRLTSREPDATNDGD